PQEPTSSQGKPCKFELIQENPDLAVRWDRPPSVADAIPSTLLHPVFGAFMDDCENIEPTPDDNELVMALSVAMSGFFGGGAERACRFREVLQEHDIDLSPIRINGATYNTDGDQQYKYFRHAIAQVTNEIGSTEAEPHIQALSCYIHSTNYFAKHNPAFRFPSIVITLFGESAVWSTRPNMQVISTALPLFYHCTDTTMRAIVARHAGALRKALQSLSECYKSMLSNTTSLPPQISGFRISRSQVSIPTSSTCHFTYCRQMDTTKLLFSVKTTDDKTLCVKFVRHYSKERMVHDCDGNDYRGVLFSLGTSRSLPSS
ncbi:hypothetical protein BDR03DRAFT_1033765, partial [Suillus americanus]